MRYLDAAQLPLAIGIFTIFPLVGYGVLMGAIAAGHARREAEDWRSRWTMLAASALPVLFAVYLACRRRSATTTR